MDEGEGKFRGETPAFSQRVERAREGQREDMETKGFSGSAKYQDGRGAGTPFCKGAALSVQVVDWCNPTDPNRSIPPDEPC